MIYAAWRTTWALIARTSGRIHNDNTKYMAKLETQDLSLIDLIVCKLYALKTES